MTRLELHRPLSLRCWTVISSKVDRAFHTQLSVGSIGKGLVGTEKSFAQEMSVLIFHSLRLPGESNTSPHQLEAREDIDGRVPSDLGNDGHRKAPEEKGSHLQKMTLVNSHPQRMACGASGGSRLFLGVPTVGLHGVKFACCPPPPPPYLSWIG